MRTKNFEVKWRHHNNQSQKTAGKMGYKPTPKKSYTDCEIMRLDAGDMSIGTAHLNPKDNYDKAAGRYYSFKASLEEFFPLSKEEKKELWDAFIEFSPKSFKRK